MNRFCSSAFVAFAVLWLVSACIDSPRNGAVLPPKSKLTTVSGLISRPNTFVKYRMMDQATRRWVDVTNGTTSGTEKMTDAMGMDWYRFAEQEIIPGDKALWRSASSSAGSQRRILAEFGIYDSVDGSLSTFDTNADQCAKDNQAGGLFGIINACASSKSPTAQVLRVCGKSDQDCCTAYNIDANKACDAGRRCDTTGRCTIPSGNLNQICNADSSCNSPTLGCVAGKCKNTTIEFADLVTLDLEIRTCSDAAKAGSGGVAFSVDLGTGTKYIIHNPGAHARVGQTDTYGLRIPGVERLSDINKLALYAISDRTCFDRLRLYANGNKVFEKTFSPPQVLDPSGPVEFWDMMIIPRDELRSYWTAIDSTAMCHVPTQIGGPQLERAITGAIGHTLRFPGERYHQECGSTAQCESGMLVCEGATGTPTCNSASFRDCTCNSGEAGCKVGVCMTLVDNLHFGSVQVNRIDNNELSVVAKFSGKRPGEQFERGTLDMQLDLEFRAGCSSVIDSSQPDGTADTMWFRNTYKDLKITRFDFSDPLAEFANAAVGGVFEAFATVAANLMVDDSAISLGDSLNNLTRPIAQCPLVSFSTATPPALQFGWSEEARGVDICLLNAFFNR